MKSVCEEVYFTGRTHLSNLQKKNVRHAYEKGEKNIWMLISLSLIVESSDSEISANDDAGEQSTHKHNEDTGGDPFWILDLNPDMQP